MTRSVLRVYILYVHLFKKKRKITPQIPLFYVAIIIIILYKIERARAWEWAGSPYSRGLRVAPPLEKNETVAAAPTA